MRTLRPIRFLPCVLLALSSSAFADETLCHGNTTDCSGPSASQFFYSGAGSSCKPASTQPSTGAEPIGSFVTRVPANGYLSEAEAANFSDLAQQCMNPIGSNFTGQGVICKYDGVDPSGSWAPVDMFE